MNEVMLVMAKMMSYKTISGFISDFSRKLQRMYESGMPEDKIKDSIEFTSLAFYNQLFLSKMVVEEDGLESTLNKMKTIEIQEQLINEFKNNK